MRDIRDAQKYGQINVISSGKSFNDEDGDKIVLAVEKRQAKEIDGEAASSEENVGPEGNKKEKCPYYVRTGLYVGVIVYHGVTFKIEPDCNNALFRRMLDNALLGIYIDKSETRGNSDQGEFPLIEYLFLTSLQKVSMLGLPQEYAVNRYHDLKVHGGLDIDNYIRKDIPFKGKISSKRNERRYIQCIVDVLSFALDKCKSSYAKEHFKQLAPLKQELVANSSGRRPTRDDIRKARTHRVLNNPMFEEYRKTLQFAEIIIQNGTLIPDGKGKNDAARGYLLDVSALWERYLERILRDGLSSYGWTVSAQDDYDIYGGFPDKNNELPLDCCFFGRSNRPDLVLKREVDGKQQVAILDAKFKRMAFDNGDVDRGDLHQIHSYAGFYQANGDNVVLCGLLYPLSEELPLSNENNPGHRRTAQLYGINKKDLPKFVIDGIYKGDKSKPLDVTKAEEAFIKRIASEMA